jgi:hypothetical protein
MVMELNEFIEKFLPDYAKKRSDNTFNSHLQEAKKYDFENYYFSEALQNFTDEICEKQRVY